jgi:hypothetical protein
MAFNETLISTPQLSIIQVLNYMKRTKADWILLPTMLDTHASLEKPQQILSCKGAIIVESSINL